MSDFTTIVRPNQTPDIRPTLSVAIRRKPVPPPEVENNRVTWGSSGNSIFQLQANLKADIEPINEEEKRTYSTVRVENPEDSDQYIETEVMTEYQARNKIDKKRFTLRFADPTASENVKILSKGNIRTKTG